MFELLLIIYLLPVVIVAALLLRLALFLLKKSIRIALRVIRKSADSETACSLALEPYRPQSSAFSISVIGWSGDAMI